MPGKEVKLSTLLHLPEVSPRENLITYKRRRVTNKSPQPQESHAVSEPASSGTKFVVTGDADYTNARRTTISKEKEEALIKWSTKKKKRDMGWAYGKMINGNRQHWQCNWCGLTRFGGGVTRLKRHIAGDLDVQGCPKAPDHVVQHVRSILIMSDTKLKKKYKEFVVEPTCQETPDRVNMRKERIEAESTKNDEEKNKDFCKKDKTLESWRCVLENMLKLSDGNGTGGVQTCIRDVLSFLDGIMQKNQVDTGSLTKCERAIVDILSNDQFGLLCTLLYTNFGDGKGQYGFYLDFSQIITCMKAGKYEGLSELFHQDIQKVWEKFRRIGQGMVDLATSLSYISTAAVEKQIGSTELDSSRRDPEVRPDMPERKISSGTNTARKSISSDSNLTLDQAELEPSQNDMCDDNSCACNYCNLPIGEWEHISCAGCNLTYHLACVNPFTKDDTVDNTWYCSACVSAKPIRSATKEEHLVSEIDARNSPENPVRTGPLKVCKICKGPEESGETILTCCRKKCPHKYYHIKCLKKCQILNATEANKLHWYCPSCFCHDCLSSKDDYLLVSCSGCGNGYHTHCIKLPQDSVAIEKLYCNNCLREKESEGIVRERENEPESSQIYEPMKMLICALESLED